MTMKLNRYQDEAVHHVDGPCLVTSCPGSGKTFVLVERVIHLIEQGVPQKNILCLTFTNKAAKEMKERICRRLGTSQVDFFIGTFHSLCAKMLRKIGDKGGYSYNFTIIDDKEQIDLIQQIARQKEVEFKSEDCYRVLGKVNYFRDQMEDDDWIKTAFTNDVDLEIAEEYLKRCKDNNSLDFSGLIYETIKIIENEDDLRSKIQNTFRYILVDETQDTNKAQFRLVNLLGEKWKNIMLIGDTDQSIYGWRGARYQNIREFMDTYSDCRVICLSKNYRSTPQIVGAADKLICNNTTHARTIFETDNPAGDPVRCYSFYDQIREADWIGQVARRLIDDGGWSPSDIAILYRMNKMSEPVEQSLAQRNVPYDVIGSWSFYDRREIRDCLAMARVLVNPKDGVSFHRAAKLLPGLGDVTIGKIENIAKTKGINLFEASREMAETSKGLSVRNSCLKLYDLYSHDWNLSDPSSCINDLINKFGYKDYMEEKFQKDIVERQDCVQQLIDAAGVYCGDKGGLSEYLQKISLVTSEDKEKDGEKVSLMSLHSAKGLEFPIVFIIGVEKDILPHRITLSDDPFEGMEEERRLFYVGMTRAKKILYVTYCNNRKRFTKFGMKDIPTQSSPFLREAGLIIHNKGGN